MVPINNAHTQAIPDKVLIPILQDNDHVVGYYEMVSGDGETTFIRHEIPPSPEGEPITLSTLIDELPPNTFER